MTIHVAARRFHCLNRRSVRRTFAERLTDVTRLLARRTGRLRDLQHHLGLGRYWSRARRRSRRAPGDKDLSADNAALALPWSTSPVEGQISRLKMLDARCMAAPGSSCCVHGC